MDLVNENFYTCYLHLKIACVLVLLAVANDFYWPHGPLFLAYGYLNFIGAHKTTFLL